MIIKKNTDHDDTSNIPNCTGYRRITFSTGDELLQWIDDNINTLELSDMVFDATIECFEKNIESIIVATLIAKNMADIDIIAKKDSYSYMIDAYFAKLLELEQYEKLAKIKVTSETMGLQFPKI